MLAETDTRRQAKAPVRVLIADDSGFFRRRILEQLQSDPMVEVVGCAENGLQAVQEVQRLRPSVVVMDIEMPVMNGIDAVRRIMRETPTPVIVFSNLTREGARVTLDALDAGAVDYLSKSDISNRAGFARTASDLCHRIRAFGATGLRHRDSAASAETTPAQPASRLVVPSSTTSSSYRPGTGSTDVLTRRALARDTAHSLVVIGASTGGPVALQRILTQLPADFAAPILLVQHMPDTFTPTFAARMDSLCALRVREATDGDELQVGVVLLAPGGCQTVVCGRRPRALRVSVRAARPEERYRPSVDLAFASVARVVGAQALAIVLTGMGADGCEGAQALKSAGAEIWAQDQASCVVYGMPAAVTRAGLADRVLDLGEIGATLRQAG